MRHETEFSRLGPHEERASGGPSHILFAVTWLVLALELALALVILRQRSESLLVHGVLSWSWSMLGLLLAGSVAARPMRASRAGQPRGRNHVMAAMVVLAACGAAGHTVLLARVWEACRSYSKTTVTLANLKGLGIAMRAYCAAHGDYPVSLPALVEAGEITRPQLLSPNDPRTAEPAGGRPAGDCSSFLYCAGRGPWRDDAEIILAREEYAWSPLEVGVSARRGYAVLMGDGTVHILDESRLVAARQRDRTRRAALGWASCE